ncbi:unnamed protein product [Ectocarpus sp. CCAP 1310/34]|nr:unnamed protein product [Ectocarpus sp. CCAP 1310/34]
MAASSQPSSSPPPTADSLVVNSDEMRILMQHRKELDESLAQLEAQIFHDEGSYIKETPCGNVIRGFENFHDSKLNAEQPKKSRMEVIEERIFSKSSFLFWQRSRDRAAKEEAKKHEREQHHAMLANRGMLMGGGSGGGGGGGANGAAEGVGHVQPLGYGSYGMYFCSFTVHFRVLVFDGSIKQKKKRSSTALGSGSGSFAGGGSQGGGGDGTGGGNSGSSVAANRYNNV